MIECRAHSSRSARPEALEPHPPVRIPLPMWRHPAAARLHGHPDAGSPHPGATPSVVPGDPVVARSRMRRTLVPGRRRRARSVLHRWPLPSAPRRGGTITMVNVTALMVRRRSLRLEAARNRGKGSSDHYRRDHDAHDRHGSTRLIPHRRSASCCGMLVGTTIVRAGPTHSRRAQRGGLAGV